MGEAMEGRGKVVGRDRPARERRKGFFVGYGMPVSTIICYLCSTNDL